MTRHLVTTWHEAVPWLVVCISCTWSRQLLHRFHSYAAKLLMPRLLAACQLRLSANNEGKNRTNTHFTINWTQVSIKSALGLQRLCRICYFQLFSFLLILRSSNEKHATRENWNGAGLFFPPCPSFRAVYFWAGITDPLNVGRPSIALLARSS